MESERQKLSNSPSSEGVPPEIFRMALFCGNAGKEIKKLSPTNIPYLTQAPFHIKKVFF